MDDENFADLLISLVNGCPTNDCPTEEKKQEYYKSLRRIASSMSKTYEGTLFGCAAENLRYELEQKLKPLLKETEEDK